MNITHSIDGFIARQLIYYCTTPRTVIESKINTIKELLKKPEPKKDLVLEELNFPVLCANKELYSKYSHRLLKNTLEELEYLRDIPAFSILPVHDCFGCSPLYVDYMRQHYNRLLWLLYDSNLLSNIVNQLNKSTIRISKGKIDKQEFYNANYPLC